MQTKITFLGAAGTVTGSKFLVETKGAKIMIDCGLFQGLKELRLKNRAPLPIDPKSLDAVILTHAHLDHSGYLPLLVKTGFKRKIFCSEPTRELAEIILLDSAKIQEEDARYANEKKFSKHEPARPLYDSEDAKNALKYFQVVPASKWIPIKQGVKFRLKNSGHILGSTFIELYCHGEIILFSGDLGRTRPLMLHAPETINRADVLVVESTYGDRLHAKDSVLIALSRVVNETFKRGGQLIIPSFSIGRTQDLLYLLSILKDQHKIPEQPVFLDSPMAIDATEIFTRYPEWHRLSKSEINSMCRNVEMVREVAQSKKIMLRSKPSIVIAGSGMIAGGRVLHHLHKRLSDSKNTVLLAGFQAAGSRGRLLQDGAPEIKIHGEFVQVHAHVEMISELSAHADQAEIISWVKQIKIKPKKIFIVHGEPQSSDALRVKLSDTFNCECIVPNQETLKKWII